MGSPRDLDCRLCASIALSPRACAFSHPCSSWNPCRNVDPTPPGSTATSPNRCLPASWIKSLGSVGGCRRRRPGLTSWTWAPEKGILEGKCFGFNLVCLDGCKISGTFYFYITVLVLKPIGKFVTLFTREEKWHFLFTYLWWLFCTTVYKADWDNRQECSPLIRWLLVIWSSNTKSLGSPTQVLSKRTLWLVLSWRKPTAQPLKHGIMLLEHENKVWK